MAVNITEGGSGTSYENQQRSDKSVQRNVFAEEGEYQTIIPRFVYSKLGNLTDNRVITVEDMATEKNEYKNFMIQMNEYAFTGIPDEDIDSLDEYLGSLGVSQEYPFIDDVYSGVSYHYEDQLLYRNVVARSLGNVIAMVNQIDYNVIHNTGDKLTVNINKKRIFNG